MCDASTHVSTHRAVSRQCRRFSLFLLFTFQISYRIPSQKARRERNHKCRSIILKIIFWKQKLEFIDWSQSDIETSKTKNILKILTIYIPSDQRPRFSVGVLKLPFFLIEHCPWVGHNVKFWLVYLFIGFGNVNFVT